MTTKKDIFPSANVLIEQYGEKTEDYAFEMMLKCLRNDDVKTAAQWLSLGKAVKDIKGN